MWMSSWNSVNFVANSWYLKQKKQFYFYAVPTVFSLKLKAVISTTEKWNQAKKFQTKVVSLEKESVTKSWHLFDH